MSNEWKDRDKRKAEWFADKSCGFCGSTENLQIDHYDPEEKLFSINWNMPVDILEPELEKCWTLCKPCHKKKTKEEWLYRRKTGHGTTTEYRRGCRCVKCKRANTEYWREYWKKKVEEDDA